VVNKRFGFGILVMALVFGMTVVEVEAQSNSGGEFTLINIPSKYDGKYAVLMGYDEEGLELIGCDSINPPKPSRIIDGKVILPMWVKRSNGRFERYSGNHSSVEIEIDILEKENDFVDLDEPDDFIDYVEFCEWRPRSWSRGEVDDRVTFSNGKVTKSYNERSSNNARF
jgi:hypothetical protein